MEKTMRQHVPELTDDIGNDEFWLIVDCFHSLFGTVDENEPIPML